MSRYELQALHEKVKSRRRDRKKRTTLSEGDRNSSLE